MYVIYPADEVVSLTYASPSPPRPRQRPTLDVLSGPLPPLADPRPPPPPPPAANTAPPQPPERAPASPTPSLERSAKRTKPKLFEKLSRNKDNDFGKIVRTPAPDEFELPAPLPTPAFSRKNIFDRDFDALFEVANSPQFCASIRVTTPEPDHRPDVSAAAFPSPAGSALSLLPPRPYSEPSSSPAPSNRTSTRSTPTPQRSSFEGSNSKPKKVSFFRFRRGSRRKESPSPDRYGAGAGMQPQPSVEMVLRELTHPAHNEQLKNQQQVTFKLVKTVIVALMIIVQQCVCAPPGDLCGPCELILMPVCGSDGVSYGNECAFNCQNTELAHVGKAQITMLHKGWCTEEEKAQHKKE